MRTTWLIPAVLVGGILVAAERAKASDVSAPVQVTSNGFYERGQSVVFDGANYWLFYGRSATATLAFQAGNPDINDYVVHYKTAASVAGLAAAPATVLGGAGVVSNANAYLGETGSAVFGGEVWAFASIDSGLSADVFGWFFDGVNWNEVASMATGLSNGSAHHDEIVFNGELFMLLRRGNFMTSHTATPKTGGWSAEVPVGLGADAGGGLAHFFVDAGKLYMAVLRSSAPLMNFIFEYDTLTDSWLKIAETASVGWDPTLFKVGGEFVFAQAPFSADGGGRQWIIQWSSPVLDATFFSGGSKLVTEGRFGVDTWIDMWPIGFTDNNGDTYLFYTSERKPGSPGPEVAGNIWQTKVDWDRTGDHHTFIQEAVDAVVGGGTISVAAGTYVENIHIDKPLELAGAGQGVTTILPALSDPTCAIGGGAGTFCSAALARDVTAILIESSNVTIHDLTVDGDNPSLVSGAIFNGADIDARNGIASNFFVGNFVNTHVHHCTVRNIYLRAIHVDTATDFHLHDDVVDNVFESSCIFNWNSSGIIEDCILSRCPSGINANHSAGMIVRRNVVTASEEPIHTDNPGDLGFAVGASDVISDNTVTGGVGIGVFNPLMLVTVENNTSIDADEGLWISSLQVGGAVPEFRNNTVDGLNRLGAIGFHETTDMFGFGFGSVNAVFIGNTIRNVDTGILLDEAGPPASTSVTINASENLIENVVDAVLASASAATDATFFNNSLSAFSGLAIASVGGATVNASGNWFGDATPAGVGAAVALGVDYTPWLGIGTDTSPAPGFQGSFSSIFVDDDSPQAGLVGRIAEGLGLVSGSTVNVAPGVYGPTVVIDDSTPDGIVVQGSDAINRPELLGGVLFDNDTVAQNGVTLKNLTLKGNADPDVSRETIVSMDNLAPVSDLTIDNCVFDGEGVIVGADGANGRFGFNGNKLTGSLSVINSEFRNIPGWSVLDTDFSFAGPPIGGSELPLTTITFENNSIHDNNGTVALRGRHDSLTAVVDVHGNSWQNIGGNFLQTGQHSSALEVNHAVTLNATGNAVSNVALGVFGEGQALQIWDIGTVDISGNTFIGNAQGIFIFGGGLVFGGPFAVPGGSVRFNTMESHADFGIAVDPTATGAPLNAENNWWGTASGPQDAFGVDEADSPLCFDPATMANADGTGDDVSNLNVDYCPWLLGPVTLSLNPDSSCLTTIGSTLVVSMEATFLTTNVVGGQFFLDYDNTALAFVSAEPGDALFAEFSEFVDEGAGTIDYAVTAAPGSAGTNVDVTMALLTFTTLTEACADAGALVAFRPATDPPTQLSAFGGGAVIPTLNDLGAVSLDAAAPVANAVTVVGGGLDGGCERLVTFSATVTDNCCLVADDVTVAVLLTTGNATLGVPNVSKVQTDGRTVIVTGDVLVSALSSCPATVQVAIAGLDCCGNVSSGTTAFGDVFDATAPVLSVPPVATIECTLSPDPTNTGQATATDNCFASPAVTFSDSAPIGVCPVVLTRTWTATDVCGNSSSADQIINVDDTTAPSFVSFPPDVTIECDESLVPSIEYGTTGGGIAIYYNDNNNNGLGGNGENPANRAFLKTQFDGTKDIFGDVAGAPYVFSNAPLSGGSLFSWHILYSGLIWPESQFGLNLVKTLPTSDGSVSTPIHLAYDNVDGTVANRSLVGPVSWALDDYKPHLPDISVGGVVNSLIRSQSPGMPLTDLEITQLDVTGPGPIFTMDIAGTLRSDGLHHWFSPSTPDSPMLNFSLNGEFYFAGTLTYNSAGDDGTDLINFYAGSLTILANSPNGSLGFPLVDDNCDSFPLLSFSDDTTGLNGCNGTGIAVRTWSSEDSCGNTATADQIITVQDVTPPVVVCPADIVVNAQAPGCNGASVTFALPTSTDNCDGAPSVACDWASGAIFPVGSTIVTCTATDACTNAAPCTFQVSVHPTNEMQVAVEIAGGVIFPASFSRCITFELWDCSGGGPAAVLSETLTFSNGVAVSTIEPSCGVYACVTARDGLHTLRATDADDFGVVAGQYVADFTDQSAFGGDNDALVSGNLNDDLRIDILDFGVFSAQWLVDYGSGDAPCATPFPHADVNGDGVVNNAELSFIQINFLEASEANCCGAEGSPSERQEPVTNVSVKELIRTGRGDLAAGDLNEDGWLNQDDVVAFLAGVRPQRRSADHRGPKQESLAPRTQGGP